MGDQLKHYWLRLNVSAAPNIFEHEPDSSRFKRGHVVHVVDYESYRHLAAELFALKVRLIRQGIDPECVVGIDEESPSCPEPEVPTPLKPLEPDDGDPEGPDAA